MILTCTGLVSSFLAITSLLAVPPGQPDGRIVERQAIPDDVKEAADDYAETIGEAIQILGKHHVKKVAQAQLADWAIRGLYKRLDERIPDEIVRRLLDLRNPDDKTLRDLLRDARQHLGNRPKLAEFRDMDLSLEGIFAHLEPETKLQSLREERMTCRLMERYYSIGAEFRTDEDSGFLRVVTPFKDSPAYKAGIRAGNLITRIIREKNYEGDRIPREVSTKGLSVEQANEALRGKRGGKVRLIVYQEDPTKPRNVTVVYDGFDSEVVLGVRRDAEDNWDFLLDTKTKIAYVRLPTFTGRTSQALKHTLAKLQQRGIRGLVVDLRGNPGGHLDGTCDCAGLFVEKASLFAEFRNGDGMKNRFLTEAQGRFRRTPLVCLIDSGTGSSSEMFVACLQDHHRAVVIGERSRGEAVIRWIRRLPHGELTFVSGVFSRPNGKPISKVVTSDKEDDDWGVRPDEGFLVKLSPKEREELTRHWQRVQIIAPGGRVLPEDRTAFRDRQLEKALEYLRKQARDSDS